MLSLSTLNLNQSTVYRFEIELFEIDFCLEHLNLPSSKFRFLLCFVALPCTRSLHILKLLGFISRRIRLITSCYFNPNWNFMASKVVRSSQAISIIRSIFLSVNSIIILAWHIPYRILLLRLKAYQKTFYFL